MRAYERPLQWYLTGLANADRVVLGQAITLIESEHPLHMRKAQELLLALPAPASQTIRIGISGAPGVGKSTMIEVLGLELIKMGHRVAVLTIDPSSGVTGGSILGDKTRMDLLSVHPQAFIRPSAAGTTLGGVARSTREAIIVAEAAGYDIVIVETVGVGQSEVAVHAMTDLFMLMLLPGAGDDLQGIKRGIVELADICVVNKADGDRLALAKTARAHYLNALHLFPAKSHGIPVQVLLASALEKQQIDTLAKALVDWNTASHEAGYHDQNRNRQQIWWWRTTMQTMLQDAFEQAPGIQHLLEQQQLALEQGQITATAAAQDAVSYFLKARLGG
jgi:LAO/AO transport system kinase